MKIKYIESEYIESGATQGSESDFFAADIDYGADVVILSKSDFEAVKAAAVGIEFEKADA